MADHQQNHDAPDRKRELRADLDRAREEMGRNFGYVRYRGAVTARVQDSVRRNSGGWLAGALVTGLFAGWRILFPKVREKRIYVDADTGKKIKNKEAEKGESRGLLMQLLGFLFSAAQPAITALISRRMLTWVHTQQADLHHDEPR